MLVSHRTMNTLSSTTSSYAFDDWQLTPEGAAIHADEQTAIIADLHLGYEWARGASGDCVVVHSLAEALARLSVVLDRARLTRVIVAGDLVESPRPCPRTSVDVRRLTTWLADRGVELLVVEGNHDRGLQVPSLGKSEAARALSASCTVAGWTVGHGHRRLTGTKTISGHHHPVLQCAGTTAPCFLVGPGRIVLPAFSSNAAGCDVVSASRPAGWHATSLRCIASTGTELLDFGILNELRRRLRRHTRQARSESR
jgi:putative SbcD/Mre11-related phosphoesterase